MKTKIKLKSILDKYIIVVDGDEKKVVYDVDDSSIFSVSITGCGRGARNAVLSKKTFKAAITSYPIWSTAWREEWTPPSSTDGC